MREAKTGFEKGGGTETRNCHACRSMRGEVCVQPVMARWSRQPRDKDGMPYVERDDICDYFSKRQVGELLKGTR